MFFGPSKDNIRAAEAIDFYTKNVVGDILVDMSKSNPVLIKSISKIRNFNLPSWTRSAQIVAVTYIYTSLSNLNVRGKNKLMEILTSTIKSQSNFSLVELMDSYSYFNQQVLSLMSQNEPEDSAYKKMLILFGEMTLSGIEGRNRRAIDGIMRDGTQIKELFTVGEVVTAPFLNYFK